MNAEPGLEASKPLQPDPTVKEAVATSEMTTTTANGTAESKSNLISVERTPKTPQPQIRRNERRTVRSIYARDRDPVDSPPASVPIASPGPLTPSTNVTAGKAVRPRIRKTDAQASFELASPPVSTTPAKSLLKYKVGMTVEARDSAMEWYRAKVVEIDEEQKRVKVHFLGSIIYLFRFIF